MKKAQVLILLILIALVVYYFSQEKATQKPSNQSTLPPFQPSILPHQPPVINCPPIPIMARKSPPAATIMPMNNQESVYFPSAEFREISPDEQYRQTLLTL